MASLFDFSIDNRIDFLKLNENGTEPLKAHDSDAGFDLYSTINYTLRPGEVFAFPLGFATQFTPKDCVGLICPRSGLAANHYITILNAPGIIDPLFSGEWKAILINHGPLYTVHKGDRIAQVLFLNLNKTFFNPVDKFNTKSDRGNKGLGSSGK